MIPTTFDQLQGNEAIKIYLQRMIEKERIAPSLLFAGATQEGAYAQVFVAQLMQKLDPKGKHLDKIAKGIHPDIHIYRPEGKLGLHSITALRHLNEEAYLPPFEAPCKAFIIQEAERMSIYSANALLKVFEEPPADTLIILLSHSPHSILGTILSRCRILYFQARVPNIKEHVLYPLILQPLTAGRFSSYQHLLDTIKIITESVNIAKVQDLENFSALQKQMLEKEREGMISIEQNQSLQTVFFIIEAWYRDLHLLRLGGDKNYLIHKDSYLTLQEHAQFLVIPSLESLQKAIKEAVLSLQRATSIEICLENFFLKLNLI